MTWSIEGAALRAHLIRYGVIREGQALEVPPRTTHEGKKILLDRWGHLAAAKRIAEYHQNGPAWSEDPEAGQ